MTRIVIPVRDYDLGATLSSGQAFRWRCVGDSWQGVVAGRWVELRSARDGIEAIAVGESGWDWLTDYLQTELNFVAVIESFPDDVPLCEAVTACRGLRLLRQEPWECLASFICSSTKQIVQIRQIVELLCERFGEVVPMPEGCTATHGFPSAERLARCTEAELRACKMGFRAPYLLGAARAVAGGELDLEGLLRMTCVEARARLMQLHGVGRKVADCVLLFAYGFQDAFPVDVWVLKALRQLYFPKRRVNPKRLLRFTETHFGPWAGYAQQYLFHYMRTKLPRQRNARVRRRPRSKRIRRSADRFDDSTI